MSARSRITLNNSLSLLVVNTERNEVIFSVRYCNRMMRINTKMPKN